MHDVWSYNTILVWVKEVDSESGIHQWLIRGAFTSDSSRLAREGGGGGADVRKPSHRSRVRKETTNLGGTHASAGRHSGLYVAKLVADGRRKWER